MAPWEFHVFLSFRGRDTRNSIIAHLYAALARRGIKAYKDDEVKRGEIISEQNLKAIQNSRFVIVILSKNYASSTWCLDELQNIVGSRKELIQQVIPIFYDIDPSDVRYQKGSFAEAFAKHEVRFNKEKVQRWRYALREVANLSGWDSKHWNESELVEDIAGSIWSKILSDRSPTLAPSVQGESSSNSWNSNSIPAQKFKVFLTFAEDTGRGFTDHLYAALRRRGIKAFKHDETLEKGEEISPQFLGAITESLIAIVVLSKTYASSTWCLDELHKVLESRKKLGQQVFPIFYGIDSSDVRHQREGFAEALAKYDERFNKEKVQRWGQALREVSYLSGWDSKYWNEAVLIENIVESIWTKLLSSFHNNNLVGIGSRMVKMKSYLGTELDDIRFIGLWGMGGIGKTTLARAVYKKISNQFEICHFLENVREASKKDGLVNLQRKLLSDLKIRNVVIQDLYEGKQTIRKVLSNKKILLVFDDVNYMSQLDSFIGYPDCFAAGSRIIITTRDKRLLKSYGVHKIYEIEAMSKDESLQLLSRNAFNKDYPEEDYLNLFLSMVQYAGGLPLALRILGSSLFTKSISQWEDALFKGRLIPNEIIVGTFKISYDELEEEDKAIFLDIACFFKGWRKDKITQVLANYDLHPTIESRLGLLIENSLIIEERNCLEVHNLLQELGRNIVLQKFPNSFCRLSRLWSPNDIDKVLKRDMGHEGLHKLKSHGVRGLYEIEIQIEEQSLQTSAVWRIMGFLSSVVGVASYSLSPSFNLLFGERKLWKIFLYCTMSFIVCGIMLFPRICHVSRSSWVKPHLTYIVLMVTTLYSFYYDKHMTKKPDVLSLISSGAFSLMSLSLSKQTKLGFELGMSIFWLGLLMLQLMKIKLILVLVAAVVCYFFMLVHSNSVPEPQARTTRGARAVNENVQPEAETTGVEEHTVDLGYPENEVERGVVQ